MLLRTSKVAVLISCALLATSNGAHADELWEVHWFNTLSGFEEHYGPTDQVSCENFKRTHLDGKINLTTNGLAFTHVRIGPVAGQDRSKLQKRSPLADLKIAADRLRQAYQRVKQAKERVTSLAGKTRDDQIRAVNDLITNYNQQRVTFGNNYGPTEVMDECPYISPLPPVERRESPANRASGNDAAMLKLDEILRRSEEAELKDSRSQLLDLLRKTVEKDELGLPTSELERSYKASKEEFERRRSQYLDRKDEFLAHVRTLERVIVPEKVASPSLATKPPARDWIADLTSRQWTVYYGQYPLRLKFGRNQTVTADYMDRGEARVGTWSGSSDNLAISIPSTGNPRTSGYSPGFKVRAALSSNGTLTASTVDRD